MSRMPFRCKHSPLFCQTALGGIVRPLIPDSYVLFHYLDDFVIPGPDPVRLRAITARALRALEDAAFVVSVKSALEPVTEIFSLGKYIDLGVRTIKSHSRSFLQMFKIWLRLATRSRPSSRLLSKALGFIHRHVRPRFGGLGEASCRNLLLRPVGGGGAGAPHTLQSPAWAMHCYCSVYGPLGAARIGTYCGPLSGEWFVGCAPSCDVW